MKYVVLERKILPCTRLILIKLSQIPFEAYPLVSGLLFVYFVNESFPWIGDWLRGGWGAGGCPSGTGASGSSSSSAGPAPGSRHRLQMTTYARDRSPE